MKDYSLGKFITSESTENTISYEFDRVFKNNDSAVNIEVDLNHLNIPFEEVLRVVGNRYSYIHITSNCYLKTDWVFELIEKKFESGIEMIGKPEIELIIREISKTSYFNNNWLDEFLCGNEFQVTRLDFEHLKKDFKNQISSLENHKNIEKMENKVITKPGQNYKGYSSDDFSYSRNKFDKSQQFGIDSNLDTDHVLDNAEIEVDEYNYNIETAFSDNEFRCFRQYCSENGFNNISDLEDFDFTVLYAIRGIGVTKYKRILKKYNEISLMNISDGKKTQMSSKNTQCNKCIKVRKLHIDHVFCDNIFLNFKNYCKALNLNYIGDLEGFDFLSLSNIRGFGETRVKKIIERYYSVAVMGDVDNLSTNFCYPIITENMEANILTLIGVWAGKGNDLGFTEKQQTEIDKYKNAIEEVGVEFCKLAYLQPVSVQRICNVLSTYAESTFAKYAKIKDLNKLYDSINSSNLEKCVYSLIMAYTGKSDERELLHMIFSDCSTTTHIYKKFESIYKSELLYSAAEPFISWLQYDVMDVVRGSIVALYKNETQRTVIDLRSAGKTLESVGDAIGVTRERVRQIEKKVQLKFDNMNKFKKYIWLLSASLNGKTVLNKKEVLEYLGDEFTTFLYLLINSDSSEYAYSERQNAFVIGNSDEVVNLENSINELSSIIMPEEISGVMHMLISKTNMPEDVIKTMLMRVFTPIGKVLSKKRLSLTDMYGIVLQRFYPVGVKLFDDDEQVRFRRYMFELFGDVKLPSNNRALDARVAEIGVLCDRGTYIHSSYVRIESKVHADIYKFVKTGKKTTYSFLEIFENFRIDLARYSNVNNRYFLQGIMKYYYKNEFYYTKDMISNSADIDRIDDHIEEYIKQYDYVTKDQLRSEFKGITESMLFFAVSRCKKIITAEIGIYMHIAHLNIIDSDYDIRKIIDAMIIEMPVSSRKLQEILYIKHADFLNRNHIYSHVKLFSVIQFMMGNIYKFSRPFIAELGTEDITNLSIIKNYLGARESFEISELIEFCEGNHIRYISWATLVDDLSDEFIRVDSNLCMNIKLIEIDEDKIGAIGCLINDLIKQKGYISARKITDYMFFPEIGVSWNGFVLKSIVERYIPEIITLQVPTSDTYLLSCVFLNEDNNCESYEEFLKDVVTQENVVSPFKSIDELKQWLQVEDLINQNLPKFFADADYLIFDKN